MAINRREVGTETEAIHLEADLNAKGYRLVQKTSDKTLQPSEYMKSIWTGTTQSFEGPKHWVITWCNPD